MTRRLQNLATLILAAVLTAFIGVGIARADVFVPTLGSKVPDDVQNVGVDEHPNAQVPLDLEFYDERGESVPLSSFFHPNRPVILQMGYYDCPKLCDVVSRGVIDSAKDIDLKAGGDFEFVFVSINPGESPNLAALKRRSFIEEYAKPGEGAGFHCLVGTQHNIDQLAGTVGFRYAALDVPGNFAHPAVLFVLTPDGKVSRYLYGVKFNPETLRLSLVEASAGKIGSTVDEVVLFICSYDHITGQYAATAMGIMKLGGGLTVLILGGFILYLFRRGSNVDRLGHDEMPPGLTPNFTK